MKLSQYISDLLVQHNCVIVPDFGGFIANYKSAVIDENRKRILPPSKGILFNPNLTNNDGLLGNAVSKGEGIKYPEALIFIRNQVEKWKNSLEEGKRVEIGEVGFLYQQNGVVIFEQSREVNLLLSAYGLGSITFVNFSSIVEAKKQEATNDKPVIVETTTKIQEETMPVVELNTSEKIISLPPKAEEKTDNAIIPIQNKRNNRWKYAAAAIAIPFLFYSYWIPVETDFLSTGNIQIADFNPIHKTAKPVYQKKERILDADVLPVSDWKSFDELTANLSSNVQVYNYQFDDEIYIPTRLNKTAESESFDGTKELVATNNSGKKYHVIGGCFSVKSNAETFIQDLQNKGFSASVLDFHKGLYRVSMGDYEKRNQATKELENFKNNGFSGWILKK